MKLFLDAGNTRIKWQLRDGDVTVARGASELEDGALFRGVLPAHWQALTSVSVCTVRSEDARAELQAVIGDHTDRPVQFFWAQERFGELVCAYPEPATMGADRWYAMIAAWQLIKGACVVVDAGSAITVDWIDDQGQHQGGYILPGRNMMLDALSQKTARVLFNISETGIATSPGQTTAECVDHGINWLFRALALQLAREASVPVVFTGGYGSLIKEAFEGAVPDTDDIRLCPDLVIDGLALAESC